MNTMIPLLLAALATARLTRLVTVDVITERPRGWVQMHGPAWLAYLVQCSWCASVWVGAAVAAGGAWAEWWTWPLALPAALAFSYMAGWLASKEGE